MESKVRLTLCIESILCGLQYSEVWGSSLFNQTAETEAWHPWVTTLPSGHESIRSLRSTTYWIKTSAVFSTPSSGGGAELLSADSLIEAELNRFEFRLRERRLSEEEGQTLDLEHEQSFVDLEMEKVNGDAEITEIMISSHKVAHETMLPNFQISSVNVRPEIQCGPYGPKEWARYCLKYLALSLGPIEYE